MPRLLSPERESEFQELSGYVDFVSTHVFGLNPLDPIHPSNALNDIVKQYGKSRALQGLRQAVNDTVEQLSDKPAEYIRDLDAKLRAQKLLTVSEVRRRYSSSYKRILRRGLQFGLVAAQHRAAQAHRLALAVDGDAAGGRERGVSRAGAQRRAGSRSAHGAACDPRCPHGGASAVAAASTSEANCSFS